MNKTRTIVIPEQEAKELQAFLDGPGEGSGGTVKLLLLILERG